MGGRVVGERRVHRARPFILARDVEAVHADHGTRRVGAADGLVDVPQPRLGMERVLALAEDAGLVAAFPRRDRLLRLEARDHAFKVAPLPHERVRVAERVAVRERRRDVVAERHLPGEERHDEADAVLLGEVAELLEMLHHALVHAGAAARGVGERLLRVEHARLFHLVELVGAQVTGVDGLEVRPVGEHAQDAEAVRGEDAQVLVHGLRVPLAPHLGGGVARPVVRAERHPPRRQEGVLRAAIPSGRADKTRGDK